jgi:hypothetical protein
MPDAATLIIVAISKEISYSGNRMGAVKIVGVDDDKVVANIFFRAKGSMTGSKVSCGLAVMAVSIDLGKRNQSVSLENGEKYFY